MKTESFVSVDSFSPAMLAERTIQRRAVEAVIWGMPAVNFELMLQEVIKLNGSYNDVVYWSRLFGWKNQTLTPNPDVSYLMSFFNTADGPVVIEVPPADSGSISGSIMDAWQSALEDVGPAGADKGEGGKYLILPPDYFDEIIPEGYIVLPCDTFMGYFLFRSNPKSGSVEDVEQAVAYGKRIKIYQLQQLNGIPAFADTDFIDAVDVVFDSAIPYNIHFFESLHRFVQTEPWLERDKVMIDQLKSIGIERAKPFGPDAKTKRLLELSAKEARAWLQDKYPAAFAHPFYKNTKWAMPASQEVVEGQQTFFGDPEEYPTDDRGVTYSFIYFSAKQLGAGQFYLMTIHDKDGKPFFGKNIYHLHVPPNPPVNLYWSATIYDTDTHTLIRNMQWASRSSLTPGLEKNADGSVDIFFGPKPPQGKDTNWIPTDPKGQFEVLARFYGPEKEFFDKNWTLPDIVKVNK